MAWRIVKQPNGLFARFSDVVDNFTHLDMTRKEAFEVCREYCGVTDAERKVKAGVEDWPPYREGVHGNGSARWNDSLNRIRNVHGEEAVQEIIKLMEEEIE